jgi:4-diphosphocytidyl-2-C-methyl-D-erythritol kinase
MLCRQTTRCLTVLAPAKLNLFLRIVARRPDGFHDIESVMASIDLYDTLLLEPAATGEIELTVVDCSARTRTGSMRLEAPVGPENLVIHAANLLRHYAGSELGARITLIKRIPSSAGLGGGSSDCAAALVGLNRIWSLRQPHSELVALAGRLGSDVAFFLSESSVALCVGRGEQIEPLRLSTGLHFVVAKPVTGLSTPAVYRHCVPDASGQAVGGFVESLATGAIGNVARRLHNGLQAPAESLNPDVQRLRKLFEQLPVAGHQMSGSGSSYFGICASRRQAVRAASRLRSAGVPWVQVVRCCP